MFHYQEAVMRRIVPACDFSAMHFPMLCQFLLFEGRWGLRGPDLFCHVLVTVSVDLAQKMASRVLSARTLANSRLLTRAIRALGIFLDSNVASSPRISNCGETVY